MQLFSLLSGLIDVRFPDILAGHGYEFSNVPRGGARSDDGGGGIGTVWIVAVVVVALVTVGIIVSLNPAGAIATLKTHGAKALILVVIAVALLAWTAFSGGGTKSLIVERWTNDKGAPELIVSLGKEDLNRLQTTNGERAVRVECLDRKGQVILDARQRWPFIDEPGYDYPHVHQPASREQAQRADRCRVRGTRVRLEAPVRGALTGD